MHDLNVEIDEPVIDFILQHASEFLRTFFRTVQNSEDLYIIG